MSCAISSSLGWMAALPAPPTPTMMPLAGVNRCAKSAGSDVKTEATDCAGAGAAHNKAASARAAVVRTVLINDLEAVMLRQHRRAA